MVNKTELEMLNNRIYGRSFGKGNDNDVGVEWNTVLRLIKKAKQEEREKIIEIIDNHKIDYTTSRKRDIQSIKHKITH